MAHLAMRPLWRCRACELPWPCPSARASLLREYRGDRTALLIYLASMMYEASAQLRQLDPRVDAATMTDRFLSWARRASGEPESTQTAGE